MKKAPNSEAEKAPSSKAERLERLRELCFEKHTVKEAARLIGVDERTGYRYAHELEGRGDRRVNRYAELRPLILAHLRRYPTSWFSQSELVRVLPAPGLVHSSLTVTLQRMVNDGEIRSLRTLREDQRFSPQWVTRWCLAEEAGQ